MERKQTKRKSEGCPLIGGEGGGREGEEKERRGINPGYENTERERKEEAGGGRGGGARKGDVHVSGEVILAAAAEPGSRSRRVPSAAPKFPRRRGGGEGGREGSAGEVRVVRRGARSEESLSCHVTGERGAHRGRGATLRSVCPAPPTHPELPPPASAPLSPGRAPSGVSGAPGSPTGRDAARRRSGEAGLPAGGGSRSRPLPPSEAERSE